MILRTFNAVHIAVILSPFAVAFVLWLALRHRSEKARRNTLLVISALNMALYWVYKYMLSIDTDYLVYYGIDKFTWLNELPLQLCNINLFIIPLGLITKKRPLLGFSFFLGSIGGLTALLLPEPLFRDCSPFLFRMIGYYGTHLIISASCISLASLGFYRPSFRDIPGVVGAFVALSLVAHCVNYLLRLGACTVANYFYTYCADVNVLNFCWKLIPIPYLYLLPFLIGLILYMVLVTAAFVHLEKHADKLSYTA